MRAVRIHAFDGRLHVDEVPEPTEGPGEVLLEVHAAGVNPIDVWVSQGLVAAGRQQLPFVLGADAVGRVGGRPVLAHGQGLGYVRDGFFRELAAVPEDVVHELPSGVDLAEAAAVGVPGSTAWLLVHRVAEVEAKDRVLVLGCTGGVGTLLVQLSELTGASVWGHTSTNAKSGYVIEHLRCEVVVAERGDLADAVASVQPTIVFDPLGGAYTEAVAESVPPRTRIVVFGTSAGGEARLDLRSMYKRAVSIETYSGALADPEDVRLSLESVLASLRDGSLRPFIDDVYPLESASAALARLDHHDVTGKVLLSVDGVGRPHS